MRDVVSVFDRAADAAGTDVLRKFGDEDAVGGGGVSKGGGGGAVDVVVFVDAKAEDGGGEGEGYAGCGVDDLWMNGGLEWRVWKEDWGDFTLQGRGLELQRREERLSK